MDIDVRLKKLFEDVFIKGNIFIDKKYFSIFSYYVLPILLILILYLSTFLRDRALRSFSDTMGGWGLGILFFLLYVRPISLILPEFKIFLKFVTLRRQLGVAVFYLVLFHAIGLMMYYKVLSYQILIEYINNHAYWLFGLIGFVLLFFLYLTSNNFAVRRLKHRWKLFQRLAYITLIIATIHVILYRPEFIALIPLVLLYFILKFMAWKKISYKILQN